MKVTYNWIKDFVDVDISPEQLADKLTMAGIEVKAIDPKDGDFVFEIEITSNRPDWLSVLGRYINYLVQLAPAMLAALITQS